MKICIPIPAHSRGGMYTFLRYFRQWLSEAGIEQTEEIDDAYDVLFTNSWVVGFPDIWRVRSSRPDVRVIQRVDGSADDYGRFGYADAQQARANMLADMTIFQSEYSKYSTMQKFKVIQREGPVIYNPVDLELFHPVGETIDLPGRVRVCNASFSTGRLKGTWQIGDLAEAHPGITFVLCGRYPSLPDVPNIVQLGHLTPGEMAAAMRSCDVYLHLALNDPCPNVVTEGLASGLPVIYINSGGTPELVGDAGEPFTIPLFGEVLDRVLAEQEEYAQRARQRAECHFSPGRIFPQYLSAIEAAAVRPLPGMRDFLAAHRQGYPVLRFDYRTAYRALKTRAKSALKRQQA